MSDLENQALIIEIKQVLLSARENVSKTVNKELITAYWNIGKIIVENEQLGLVKAEYGKQLLKSLSKALTVSLARVFQFQILVYAKILS